MMQLAPDEHEYKIVVRSITWWLHARFICPNLPLRTFKLELYGVYDVRFVTSKSRFIILPSYIDALPTFT